MVDRFNHEATMTTKKHEGLTLVHFVRSFQSARCAAEDSGRGARTSRGGTPPPASALQPGSIRLIPPPAWSTITARG